jgi:general secretion pathway protein F
MQFAYEAMRSDGSTVLDRIEAGGRNDAAHSLREQGLIVLRLEEQAAARAAGRRPLWQSNRITVRDLVLLTRQMKMLLESGAPVVPALEAAHEQTSKPIMRAVLERVRTRVEEGDSLSEALDEEAEHFDPVFRSMIAAGEATASLPEVFGRLGDLVYRRQQTRQLIFGALLYPAILTLLLVGVVCILVFFVVPRFKILFSSLNSPLPATTQLLFSISQGILAYWPFIAGALGALIVTAVVLLRAPGARPWFDRRLLSLPVVGKLASRLIFARVLRVWAAMLRCHVPLLEAIQQSREAVGNRVILDLLAQVEESVATGGRVGPSLAHAGLADPIIVSAIQTGEDNGRLAEATDFVSGWLDEDNSGTVQQITRLFEPILLAVMGLVVGFVAMALFVPLFDMATAAG